MQGLLRGSKWCIAILAFRELYKIAFLRSYINIKTQEKLTENTQGITLFIELK